MFSIFKVISHQPPYSIHLQYKYEYTYPIEKVEDFIFKWLRESKNKLRQDVHIGVFHTMGVGSGKERWTEGQEGTLQSQVDLGDFFFTIIIITFPHKFGGFWSQAH